MKEKKMTQSSGDETYHFKRTIAQTIYYEQTFEISHVSQEVAIEEAHKYGMRKMVHPEVDGTLVHKQKPVRLDDSYHIGITLEMMKGNTRATEKIWKRLPDYSFQQLENLLDSLSFSLRDKICNIFKKAGTEIIEFDTSELDEPTYVYWTNGKGETYDSLVVAVLFSENTISYRIDVDDEIVNISEKEGELATRCHEWQVSIIYNLCETVGIDPEKI